MRESLREEYRRKAAAPGLSPVLDPGDAAGLKNEYLDLVHRRALLRHVHLLGPRAADLGCGIGRLAGPAAEGRWLVGVDGSPELLALARGRLGAGARLVQGDVTALPLASGSLTGALMAFVTLHMDDAAAARAFAEASRVLQPGGRLLLLEHVAPGGDDRSYHGVLDRSRASIERLLAAAGLEVEGFLALKKTPSRVVHWVKTGRLPRALWRAGAWLDRGACSRRPELADYVECLVVARRPGGPASPAAEERHPMLSLVVPRRWLR